MDEIRSIHHESRFIYGAPKITKKLTASGYEIAEKTVGQYMRDFRRTIDEPQFVVDRAYFIHDGTLSLCLLGGWLMLSHVIVCAAR